MPTHKFILHWQYTQLQFIQEFDCDKKMTKNTLKTLTLGLLLSGFTFATISCGAGYEREGLGEEREGIGQEEFDEREGVIGEEEFGEREEIED